MNRDGRQRRREHQEGDLAVADVHRARPTKRRLRPEEIFERRESALSASRVLAER